NNVGASEPRRQPTTPTLTPMAERGCPHPQQCVPCKQCGKFGQYAQVRCLLRVGTPALLLLLLTALTASAADSPPVSVTDAASPLQPLLDGLLGKYGWLTTVILVIGSLRILFKPVMVAIENYVKQ